MTSQSLETKKIKPIVVSLVAALGGFLFGYDSAVINGATEALRADFHATSAILGFAVAAALIGAAIGAFYGAQLADKYGRTNVMKVAAVLFFISCAGSGLAPEIYSLVAFRVLGGLGIGVASIITPLYISEMSPANIRGRLSSLQQLAIVVGIFSSQLVNERLLVAADGDASNALWFDLHAWRWMLLVACIPALFYMLGAFMIPESPRYLVQAGKLAEARAIIARMPDTIDVEEQVKRIQDSLASAARVPGFAALKGAVLGLKPIVWVGIALAMLQQFVGINVIFYYSNSLWMAVGFATEDAFRISLITSLTNVVVTFIAIALVDKWGRKPLLLTGSIGMMISLATLAVAFSQAVEVAGEVSLPQPWGIIGLIAANLFVVFFGMSWGPVMWVMLGEMFPNAIKGPSLAIAGLFQWIANFLVTVSFPWLADTSLTVAYGMYAAFALISGIFVWKYIRETKGVALEDMDEDI